MLCSSASLNTDRASAHRLTYFKSKAPVRSEISVLHTQPASVWAIQPPQRALSYWSREPTNPRPPRLAENTVADTCGVYTRKDSMQQLLYRDCCTFRRVQQCARGFLGCADRWGGVSLFGLHIMRVSCFWMLGWICEGAICSSLVWLHTCSRVEPHLADEWVQKNISLGKCLVLHTFQQVIVVCTSTAFVSCSVVQILASGQTFYSWPEYIFCGVFMVSDDSALVWLPMMLIQLQYSAAVLA